MASFASARITPGRRRSAALRCRLPLPDQWGRWTRSRPQLEWTIDKSLARAMQSLARSALGEVLPIMRSLLQPFR